MTTKIKANGVDEEENGNTSLGSGDPDTGDGAGCVDTTVWPHVEPDKAKGHGEEGGEEAKVDHHAEGSKGAIDLNAGKDTRPEEKEEVETAGEEEGGDLLKEKVSVGLTTHGDHDDDKDGRNQTEKEDGGTEIKAEVAI